MKLNAAQREAVLWEGGPLLVLAGPGSGKTHTIIERIFFLLEQGAAPEQLLVLTFTREAAASMQRRFQQSAKGVCPVSFGTFHSVFYHILNESQVLRSSRFLNNSEKKKMILSVLKKYQSDSGAGALETLREDAGMLLSAISYYKNTACMEEAVKKAPPDWQREFTEIYRDYEALAAKEKVLDYDDILFLTRRLLLENRGVRTRWQERFPYLLIDEFQDINPIQYEIVRLLSAPPHHLFAVGDDDQSIYGFRGSAPACLKRFVEDFHARQILLNVNYRSTKEIVDASLRVISESSNRFEKQLQAAQRERKQGKVTLLPFPGKEQEQDYLVQRLRELLQTGEVPEAAVLFRTNAAMQSFASALRREKLPYSMKEQGKSIYEHFIVMDIMAYLLLAEGREEREYLLRIINRPCRFISREEVEGGGNASAGMQQLQRQLQSMRRLPPRLGISYVLKAVGYERYLRRMSADNPGQWEEWQEILEWLSADAGHYERASRWYEEQKLYTEAVEKRREAAGERRGEDAAPIRLMTVHASKGLEFDTVLIPDCNEGVFPYGRMPDTEQSEEERRLLYVAMTRAKRNLELLYLTGTKNSPRLPSRFLNPLLYSSSSSTSSSNSQPSRYSSKASATFSYSSSSSM